MDYPQPMPPACMVVKWHFAAEEGCILEEGVGRRKESIRAQLWVEVGKKGLEHLWPEERWTGGMSCHP